MAADQWLCIAPGATQNGPVEVRPGGALAVSEAEINGPMTSDGGLAVTTDCAGSAFKAPLTLHGNTGGLEVSSDTLSASRTTP